VAHGPAPAAAAAVLVLLAIAIPEAASAQAEALGQQRLGRAYWHVFLAYAIGWVLILGWVVSIARRLGRVEARLNRDAG
jgi:CcmD family protein